MDTLEFCKKVDTVASKQYNVEDGGDLCYNLLEQKVIALKDGVLNAARIVAQYYKQA